MMTRMTGTINRVLDDEVRLQVGPFEYQVLVPEFVRRQLQTRLGQELTLHISEYLEGSQMSNRMIPRKIGFQAEADLEFFDLFCTVEKIGAKKALKALVRPVREIADAIHRQDAKWLTTLPGIGGATAEQIVTTLKKKVTRYAHLAELPPGETADSPANLAAGKLIEELYTALMSVGHNPQDARNRIDALIASGQKYGTLEEALTLVYKTRS